MLNRAFAKSSKVLQETKLLACWHTPFGACGLNFFPH